MCGIAGIQNIRHQRVENLQNKLLVMNYILKHRGPDGEGVWKNKTQSVGFGHRRLSIIDLNTTANQPMMSDSGLVVTFNGEIYNYLELRASLKDEWTFKTNSDTETILALYEKYGFKCVESLQGMFSFGLWNEKDKTLFCARDRFGIKPFYYMIKNDQFFFASEIKGLLPFIDEFNINEEAYSEYITFQYTISDKTLVNGIYQLLPGHALAIINGQVKIWKYWDVQYSIDYVNSVDYFEEKLGYLLQNSVVMHQRSDVPVACYVSGGIDSSLMAILAHQSSNGLHSLYHGRFTDYSGYDESKYAQCVADMLRLPLNIIDIKSSDFFNIIQNVIYYLDSPVAGPGAFPQYMVSKLASEQVKVILGGQGGDEIFGGYARYILGYFDQCLRAAIDGTYGNDNFPVSPESIFPNLGILREYKGLINTFWSDGIFQSLDARYFRLIDRSYDFSDEIDWRSFNKNTKESVYEKFKTIFNDVGNDKKIGYFDKMTRFDFKYLLPALLQVEDRMSMAHGLETRVPFLDQKLVEFVSTIPASIKFEGGKMKHLIKTTYGNKLPGMILNRRDKMGFPVPLKEWFSKDLKSMLFEILGTKVAHNRPFINSNSDFFKTLETNGQFSRKLWALLSLELWYQSFYDRHSYFKGLINNLMIQNHTHIISDVSI